MFTADEATSGKGNPSPPYSERVRFNRYYSLSWTKEKKRAVRVLTGAGDDRIRLWLGYVGCCRGKHSCCCQRTDKSRGHHGVESLTFKKSSNQQAVESEREDGKGQWSGWREVEEVVWWAVRGGAWEGKGGEGRGGKERGKSKYFFFF